MGSSCQGSRYGTEKAGCKAVNHVQNHTCRLTLLQTARRTAVFGQPSSLRPHWCNLWGEGGMEKLSNAKKVICFPYSCCIIHVYSFHVVWRCCAARGRTKLLSSLVNASSNHEFADINRQSHDQRAE